MRLPRRPYNGQTGDLYWDLEAYLQRLSDETDASFSFQANPADWADPPPTTLAEAVARLAAANPGA